MSIISVINKHFNIVGSGHIHILPLLHNETGHAGDAESECHLLGCRGKLPRPTETAGTTRKVKLYLSLAHVP